MDKKAMDEKASQTQVYLLICASSALFFLFSILCLSVITYLLKFQIIQIQFALSCVFTFIFMMLASRHLRKLDYVKQTLKMFGFLSGIFIICMSFASVIVDLSYDGQGYHQATMVALDKGWNPYSQDIFDKKDFKSQNTLWVESYPNANGIIAANIFKVTNNIESGKATTLFLIVTSWALGFIALLKLGVNRWLSGLLISIAILNPINILQIFTFGLDSQFYSMVLILLSVGIFIIKDYYRYFNFLNLLIITVLLVNNKLTSFVYLTLFGGSICLYLLWQRQFKVFYQTAAVFIASVVAATLVIGYHPFVTNYLNHSSVLYPVYTSSTNDKPYDFSENRPSNYVNESQISLLFKSMFFKSNGNFRPPEDVAAYKVPFTFSKSESNSFLFLGPKEGGFGVFFSGIVVILIALIGSMLLLVKSFTGKKANTILIALAVVVVIASSIINPLNSVARYIPQFWLIIPLIMWLSWNFRHKVIVFLSAVIVILVFMNSTIIFSTTASFNISRSIQLGNYLQKLAKVSKSEPILVNFSQSEGNRFLLDHHNVSYREDLRNSTEFTCPTYQKKRFLLNNIGNSTSLVCLGDENLTKLKN